MWRPIRRPISFLTRKIAEDFVGRGHLGVVVQMGVDVAGGSDVAVAQPLLNVLEGHTVGVEKGRAGMPEIMEPDAPHPVFFEKFRKGLREIPRLDPLPDCVDIDIVQKVFAVFHYEPGRIPGIPE